MQNVPFWVHGRPDCPSGRDLRPGHKSRRPGHNLVRRLRKRKESVLWFVHDLQVPSTNNQAGRDLRMMKLKMKISDGFRSQQGAKDFATLRSVLSTAQKQGLHRCPDARAGQPASWNCSGRPASRQRLPPAPLPEGSPATLRFSAENPCLYRTVTGIPRQSGQSALHSTQIHPDCLAGQLRGLSNIPGYDRPHLDPAGIFGTDVRAEQSAIAKELSAVSLVSADDPPTYMRYSTAPGNPIPEGDRARGWKVHHVQFGLLLRERLTAVGVETHLSYPGAKSEYSSVAEFFAAKFGQF